MKTTSFVAIALQAATAFAAGCNVEGNLFNLRAVQTTDGNRRSGSVQVGQIGELHTDVLAQFSDASAGGVTTESAVFYINTDNNRLIVLDPFNLLKASNCYTDAAEGGELKFTFFNDTGRPNPYNWPSFSIVDDFLTVDGKKDAFTHCPTDPDSALLTGSIAIGAPDESCRPLDGLQIYPVTSQISQE